MQTEDNVKYVSSHLQSIFKSEIDNLIQVEQLKIIENLINFLENLKHLIFTDSAKETILSEETVVQHQVNTKFDCNEQEDLQEEHKNNYDCFAQSQESKDVLQVEKSDVTPKDKFDLAPDVESVIWNCTYNDDIIKQDQECDALELSNNQPDQHHQFDSPRISDVGESVLLSFTTVENIIDDRNVTGNGLIAEESFDDTEIENYDSNDINSHLIKTQDGYECNLCQKLYRTLSNIREHLQSSHNIGVTEELSCPHQACSYTTFSSGQYRAHKSWHANNAALVCPVCNKEYLGGTKGLRNHMKIHSKNKDYICKQCNKQFINLSRLNYHIQNVHGDFIHLCEICNKQFRSKPNLIRHQQVHTNDNGYLCPCCPFTTSFSSSLTSHVRTVHKIHNFTTGKIAKLVKKDVRRNNTPRDKVRSMQNIINQEGEQLCSIDHQNESVDVPQPRRRQIPVTLLKANQVEKPLFEHSNFNEQNPIISVKNSAGQLVDAVVQIKESDCGDAELHVTMSSTNF